MKIRKTNITGIILAGGKSSRMGFDKGLAEISGKTSIEYVYDTLKKITDQIIVVANNDAYDFLRLPVYEDILKGYGPLGGIYTGLTVSDTEKNLIVACDMPFVTEELLQHIIEEAGNYEIAVPVAEEEIHPLCACYTKYITVYLQNLIINQILKMKKVIQFFNFKKIPIDDTLNFYSLELLMNINTVKELNKAEKSLSYAS